MSSPTLRDYLQALYPAGTTGDLLALVVDPFKRCFGSPDDLDAFARKIEALDAKHDTYLTINTLDGKCVRKRGRSARGLESEVAAVVALVADVDAAPKPKHDYPTQRRIIDALADMPLAPSMIVISGRDDGGLHVYWLLAMPFVIRSDEDRDRIKRLSKGWQGLLKAKLAPKELDSTFDLVRVLRPIGTTNKKYGTQVKAKMFEPDRRFTLEDFEAHMPKPEAKPITYTSPASIESSKILDRARKYLAKCPSAVSGANGSNAAYHAACVLVKGFALPIDQAKPLLLDWNRTCEPPWSEAELDHKLNDAEKADGPRGELLNADRPPARTCGPNGQHKSDRHDHTSDSFPLTDTGLAERFALQHGDVVRYCYPWAKYLCWDGTRWKIDDQGSIDQLAKQTVRAILREAYEEPDDSRRKELMKFAKSAESVSRRDAMLRLARSEPPIPISPEALDRDPWILNCPNGKIDLRTGNLCEHRREDYITKLCPVEYRHNALCPTWLATLNRIFAGDGEIIGYLQRFIGYSLTGDVSEQVLNIWYGKGANGKSTVANAIMEMLGSDYSMKGGADLLLQKHDSDHPTALTDLHGKRFVACIETEENRRLAESLVKELTGGDPIRARRMREDFWEFLPTHKVVLACNHRPIVRGTDHAIWRRLKLVPYNVVIPPHERDKNLPAKLRGELRGILAWAVRGCIDWQQNGLGDPKAVVEATACYQDAENVLLNFIAENCVREAGARVKGAELVETYREWSGDKTMTTRKMTAALTEMGIERYTNNGTWYRGIGLQSTE